MTTTQARIVLALLGGGFVALVTWVAGWEWLILTTAICAGIVVAFIIIVLVLLAIAGLLNLWDQAWPNHSPWLTPSQQRQRRNRGH